tara:strand:+ start:3154 stop:3690 length:537 start_codon:yes stop_codon:yes gene_type:complete
MAKDHSKWFLVYAKAREEARAKKNLEDQGFEIFLPMISYESRTKKKLRSLEAMFPRYLFIKINLEKDNWNNIRSTRGVSHVIMFGHKLAEVPYQIIKYLKQKVNENDTVEQKIINQDFQRNDTLIIKAGILKGREAQFLSKTGNERVRILLKSVSELITAEIPASDAGKKAVIEAFKL